MQKLYEDFGLCPVCRRQTFRVSFYIKDIPPEGPSILSVGLCSNCGHRDVKIYPLEGRGERRLVLRYPEDENVVLYLPPNTEIRVVEGDAELLLTNNFSGRITTLEGVVEMIREMGGRVEVPCTLEIKNEDGLLRIIRIS